MTIAFLAIVIFRARPNKTELIHRNFAPAKKRRGLHKKHFERKISLDEIKKVLKNKNFGLAEELLKKYLSAGASREDFYEAEFMLGYVFLSQNRPAEALSQFKDISLANPPHKRSPDATYMVAEIYRRKFADKKNAWKFYERYLELWPQGRLAKRIRKKYK